LTNRATKRKEIHRNQGGGPSESLKKNQKNPGATAGGGKKKLAAVSKWFPHSLGCLQKKKKGKVVKVWGTLQNLQKPNQALGKTHKKNCKETRQQKEQGIEKKACPWGDTWAKDRKKNDWDLERFE